MHDGTTPLMLAVRLAVEGMVEELINADADVNAIDAQGKYHPANTLNKKTRTLLTFVRNFAKC